MTATLNNPVQGGFTADVVLANLTTDGAFDDFSANTTNVTFTGNVGETVDIVINITDDSIVEGTEQFTVGLNNVVPGDSLVSASDIDVTAVGTVDIADNDSASIVLDDIIVDEDAGTIQVKATLLLSLIHI